MALMTRPSQAHLASTQMLSCSGIMSSSGSMFVRLGFTPLRSATSVMILPSITTVHQVMLDTCHQVCIREHTLHSMLQSQPDIYAVVHCSQVRLALQCLQ